MYLKRNLRVYKVFICANMSDAFRSDSRLK